MLCARSCPDWCIYIEGHKEKAPPRRPGGKPRQVNALDRFDIDYSLCMYCGICVEVCPFEALFWSPEYEYSEPRIADLLHDKERLGEWMETVPAFEPYESGSESSGANHLKLSVKFYLTAILFVVFDIEVVFIYPWAIQFRELGWLGMGTMFGFLSVVIVALVYVWKKGALEWES